MRRTPAAAVALCALAALLPANLSGPQRAIASSAPDNSHRHHYSATITYTKGGIPHILAKTFGDAGYGYGYAVGKVQGITRNGHFIPIQGGEADPNGEFNAISAPWTGAKRGEGDVDDGTSFVQVVTWQGRRACPVARTILTYSESTDPTNPHYDDQTKMFSKKHWVHDEFCTSVISADPHRHVIHLTGT